MLALPTVRWPAIAARPWSCRAAAISSPPPDVSPLTSTTTGKSVNESVQQCRPATGFAIVVARPVALPEDAASTAAAGPAASSRAIAIGLIEHAAGAPAEVEDQAADPGRAAASCSAQPQLFGAARLRMPPSRT